MQTPYIIGHRGSPLTAPENTLESFSKAINEGADMIELDVRVTKDNKLIVIHDKDVKRMTREYGVVRELTLKEIKRLKIRDNTIPTLQEAIDFIKGKADLNIEIKSPGISHEIAKIVENNNLVNNVLVSSFLPWSLKLIKERNPKIKTALLFKIPLKSVTLARAIGCDAIHPYYLAAWKGVIKEARKYGLRIHVWTLNNKLLIKRFIKLGVHGIITDKPKLMRWIKK